MTSPPPVHQSAADCGASAQAALGAARVRAPASWWWRRLGRVDAALILARSLIEQGVKITVSSPRGGIIGVGEVQRPGLRGFSTAWD